MKNTFIYIIFVGANLILTACNDERSSKQLEPSFNTAVVQTRAADNTSASLQFVGLDEETPTVSSPFLTDTRPDYIVRGYKDSYYYIGRLDVDRLTRFNKADITNPELSFNVGRANGDISPNVYDLVFASPEKAYMIRYADNKIWIVNPKADKEEDFKIGEIDITPYADSDGIPEAASAAIVDGRLFVAMQRLDRNNGWSPVIEAQSAYVAVFNITDGSEIDTNPNDAEENLKGIALSVRNPQRLLTDNKGGLYLIAVGDRGSSWAGRDPAYVGGIQKIDINNYSMTMIVDDGDEASHPYGNINDAVIIDDNNGYFVAYYGYKDNSLYHFNPGTGDVTGIVDNIQNTYISLLAASPAGNAWVGVGSENDPHLLILNKDQEQLHRLSFARIPETVTFLYEEKEEESNKSKPQEQ